MSPVTLVCPNFKCKAVLEVGENLRGQRVRCNRCGQVILVPPKPAKRK